MGDFFHGWRRKAGCVTLVMACALTSEWTRSPTTDNEIPLSRTVGFVSSHGSLTVVVMDRGGHRAEWYPAQSDRIIYHTGRSWSKKWRRTVAVVNLGTDEYGNAERVEDIARWCRVPYWSIVVPLTLLSAYLILWKPRKRGSGPPQS